MLQEFISHHIVYNSKGNAMLSGLPMLVNNNDVWITCRLTNILDFSFQLDQVVIKEKPYISYSSMTVLKRPNRN